MTHVRRLFQMVSAVFCIATFISFSALAAAPQPPFFGPPNMHTNTKAGSVAVTGGDQQAYPAWRNDKTRIYIQSPWSDCAHFGEDDFLVAAYPTTGVRNLFDHWGRSFQVDQFDADGHPIGGTYSGGIGWPSDSGTLLFEKSTPSKTTYDQVRLVGTKSSGPVNTILSLVEHSGYIGVANIASLGVINPCGAANASSQIWIPLGTGSDGQPAVILDIDGDGAADAEFLPGPPVSGYSAPPPTPIPTLSEWGLAGLTVIFLMIGLHYSRKKGIIRSA